MANATIKSNLPVFVSSTFEDLRPYREAAQQVLIRLGQIVKGMEFFGSNTQKPLDVCLNSVRQCKIYIAIIGMRYGSIDEKTGKSFTQLEYEEAIKCQIPTLIYIMSDDCLISPKYIDIDYKATKLVEFKNLLKARHTVSFFNSPEDLSTKLTQDIIHLLDEMGEKINSGEIRGDIQKDFENIFKRFIFRPVKYQFQEGILRLKISDEKKSSAQIKTNIISALGMIQGEAVCVPVYVLEHETLAPMLQETLYLYGEKELGDWIEEVLPGTIVSAKVRLSYIVTPEIERYDGGSIVREVAYTNLILLEVLSENK